jgi:hypothetical protein
MKKLLMILLLLTCFQARAQTFAEWFNQVATQSKYLLEQIAALKAYHEVLEKGYDIAHEGLTLIGDIKDGEFRLHRNYFDSLRVVKPAIRSMSKAKEITLLYDKVLGISGNAYALAQRSGHFSPQEAEYVRGVYERVMSDFGVVISALVDVIESGTLSMKDDERINRIDALFNDVHRYHTFAQDFYTQVRVLAVSRMRAESEIETSRLTNGL